MFTVSLADSIDSLNLTLYGSFWVRLHWRNRFLKLRCCVAWLVPKGPKIIHHKIHHRGQGNAKKLGEKVMEMEPKSEAHGRAELNAGGQRADKVKAH